MAKKINKIIKYMGETPIITIEGYTGKLSWVSRHIENNGANYWEFVFEEEIKEAIETKMVKHVPHQLCPKCNGGGTIGMFGMECDLCKGKKIIPMHKL